MSKLTNQFQTIRTEGALLPPDILQRIASLKVDGVRPADYHLPDGFRINDAITQSWDMLKKYWKNFQEARERLAETEHGTALTNERWLLPLFKELEYGRLSTSPSPQIEDRSYPIERFYNHTPVHLIGCNLPLDRRTKGARGAATSSPHSMMQEFLNRSDQHQWGFLSNGRQLRILRDNVSLSRQAYVEFDLEGMMEGEVYGDFVLLWLLCHQSRVEAERPENCWLEQWSKLAREEGTRVLNNLRTGVTRAIELLGQGFLAHPQNHELRSKLQESGTLTRDDFYRQLLRIVYRLLFLFVAEDRKLLHPPDADEAACELYDQYYSTLRLREMAFKLRGSKHADLWHSLSLVFDGLHRDNGLPELGLPALGSFLWDPKKTADLLGPAQSQLLSPSPPDKGERAGLRAPSALSNTVFISNNDLLAAIRTLAYVEQDKVLRSVDYRNLGTEEFGSVYESLLELRPTVHVEARTFNLGTAVGNERKTSGSYYTPDSLVQCLLDSALDPVVVDRLKGKKGTDAEDAILAIKVCDPACGSGHFLIAAAHRLARHLARIRTGESEPGPEDYQHALRDVIGRCIYGVDINPMAVELCKVSLWMEAIDPGRPLSFLDHHIQVGNSLLGVTPKLLEDGIPDDAFSPIEGDVKKMVSSLKAQNKKEQAEYRQASGKLQKVMFGGEPFIKLGNLPAEFTRLSSSHDDSVAELAAKERKYAELVSGADYLNARLLADTWCAAFVWIKNNSDLGKMCPTERDFRKIENSPHSILPHVKTEVRRLADQYQFFHWHLAFPDVFRVSPACTKGSDATGCDGGFDVVFGNPPWERVRLMEKEWFADTVPEITQASNASARRKMIAALEVDAPQLFHEYMNAVRFAEANAKLLRESRTFPLCGRGDVNLYAVFAELFRRTINDDGRSGAIVPTGIATDDSTKFFFQDVVSSNALAQLVSFENSERLFADVKTTYRFCLLTTAKTGSESQDVTFAFFLTNPSQLTDATRTFTLTNRDIAKLNPNTNTCPVFRTASDALLCSAFYRRNPVLWNEQVDVGNTWNIEFQRIFHMTDDAALFMDAQAEEVVASPHEYFTMWEDWMVHHFDHRYQSNGGKIVDDIAHQDASYAPDPRYVVARNHVLAKTQAKYFFGFRNRTNVADSRAVIGTILPQSAVGNTVPLIHCDNGVDAAILSGMLSSFALDYCARQKIGGMNLNYFIIKQFPCISRHAVAPMMRTAVRNVLELTYTAWDLEAFALDCGYDGPPFRWDQERRFLLRCELDAAYFHLYLGSPADWGRLPEEVSGAGGQVSEQEVPGVGGQVSGESQVSRNPKPETRNPLLPLETRNLKPETSSALAEMFPTPRDAVAYIMETFPIVKRKDIKRTTVIDENGQVTQAGTFITKDTILAIYDEMQQATETGTPYQTRLNPPPGPPTDADGHFIPYDEWTNETLQVYAGVIHPPRVDRTTSKSKRLEKGEKILILRLLLARTKGRVQREVLELMLLFALNNGLCRRVIENQPAKSQAPDQTVDTRWLSNFDRNLKALEKNGILQVEVSDLSQFISAIDSSGLDGPIAVSFGTIVDEAHQAFEIIRRKREDDAFSAAEISRTLHEYLGEGDIAQLVTL